MDTAKTGLNLYQKIILTKNALLSENIKKSGHNKFSDYWYFELGDILPVITKCEVDYRFMTAISFTNEYGMLTIVDAEDPTQVMTYTCPMSEANLKGCHPVQNSGAVQTYLRRYLLVNAFNVSEHDAVDASPKTDEPAPKSKATPAKTAPILISKQQIDSIMREVKSQKNADDLKAILKSFNINKLAETPIEKYDDVYNKFMETQMPFPLED